MPIAEVAGRPPRLLGEAAAVFPLFALVTFAVYWPVFVHPGTDTFLPFAHTLQADVHLLLSILSTVARSLVSNPTDLFAGDTLYPDPAPIVHSEHLLAQQVTFAPLFLLTGNPVLGMQGSLFLNMTLCGVSMYLLLRHWRVSPAAAVFGGFVYANFPARYFDIHAPHVSAVQYLPLALLFLDRTLTRPRVADAVLLSLFAALQMLTSFYLAYVTVFVLGSFGLVAVALRRGATPRSLVAAGAAAVAAGGVLLVVALPYLESAARGGFREHDPGLLMVSSNTPWASYVYPPIAVRNWGWRMMGIDNYLGVLPLVLALAGTALWLRPLATSPVLPVLCAVAVTYLLALGPTRGPNAILFGKPYDLASEWLPGFAIMRVPHRFGSGVMLGVAVLAAFGLESAIGVLRRRRWRTVAMGFVVAVLCVAVAFEFGLFHFRYRTMNPPVGDEVPPVYRALAELDAGPVVEIPGGFIDGVVYQLLESRYTYLSIFHRQKLLNGYTGYWPPTYRVLMGLTRSLPDPRALELLTRMTGLRYLVLHEDQVPAIERGPWRDAPGLKYVERFGRDVLFEAPRREADLLEALLANRGSDRTVLGTPLAPLAEAHRAMGIRLAPGQDFGPDAPIVVRHRTVPVPVRVVVENRSAATWPALALDAAWTVHWAYRWERPDGTPAVPRQGSQPLAYDLAPGQSVATTLRVLVPRGDDPVNLVIGLRQGTRWLPEVIVLPVERRPAASGTTAEGA
jgi:hypothetical protein